MPAVPPHSRSARCSSLLSHPESAGSQSLDPDPLARRARDLRGRFAKGSSGNVRGRPPGIPNPRRGVADLRVQPPRPGAIAALIERKPHLLIAFAAQLLPPPRRFDPAAEIGIDPASLVSTDDFRRAASRILAAAADGIVSPAQANRLARRLRTRQRVLRRCVRIAASLRKFCPPPLNRNLGPNSPLSTDGRV